MIELYIDHKPYEKKTGVACFAPYVSVLISPLSGQNKDEIIFDARIDTGADITCIPRSFASKLGPLILGNPLTVRGHDGNVHKVWTYRMAITMLGYPENRKLKAYRPERGILLTDSNIGLVGMDIISSCRRITFDSELREFFIEC
jgi:hypothetical protein